MDSFIYLKPIKQVAQEWICNVIRRLQQCHNISIAISTNVYTHKEIITVSQVSIR